MPRAIDMSTKNIQKMILKTALDVKSGEVDTKKGNTMISGFRAILYGNQLNATEERLAIDRRLADSMEALNEYISNGGTLPPLQEVENHEENELQGNEDIPGSLPESK